MTNLNIKIHIDESSVSKLLNRLSQEQRDSLTADDIMWKVGETYSQNNETYMPIYAIGIKPKNQFSDEESQQVLEVLEQSPLIPLVSGLPSEVRYYYHSSQPLELPSTSSPDWMPLLHKE